MIARFPFTPFPDGVYAVAFSHDLSPEKVIPVTFMGEELALFRTKTGDIGAIGAYCPHLGANLTCDGVVKNDALQCPFHGLRFKTDGCSNAKSSRRDSGGYKTKSWNAFEKYGLIFLAHNPAGSPLNIDLPEWDMSAWSKPILYSFKVKSHPQEILENSVDQLHFFHVHKYRRAKSTSQVRINGAELIVDYELQRSTGLFGFLEREPLAIKLNIHTFGLGASIASIFIKKYSLTARQVVFPTPIDGESINIRTLTSVKLIESAKPLPEFAVPRVVRKVAANALCQLSARGFLKDFLPDITVWENKRYVAEPKRLPSDGDFELYRQWASQFYRGEAA